MLLNVVDLSSCSFFASNSNGLQPRPLKKSWKWKIGPDKQVVEPVSHFRVDFESRMFSENDRLRLGCLRRRRHGGNGTSARSLRMRASVEFSHISSDALVPSSFLLLVVRPGAPSSFLLLLVRHLLLEAMHLFLVANIGQRLCRLEEFWAPGPGL